MAKFAGRKARVYVGTTTPSTLIGGLDSVDFQGSKAELDQTAYEDGDFMTYLDGYKSATVVLSGRRDEADAGQQLVIDSFEDNPATAYKVRFDEAGTTSGNRRREASFIVTSWNETPVRGGVATFSATLRITGTFVESTQ